MNGIEWLHLTNCLHEMNNFWLVWSSGMKICLMRRVLTCRDVSLAHEHLTDITLRF